MKFALLPLLLLPLISAAQFSKGDIAIGGSFGVNSQSRSLDSQTDYKSKGFSVNPSISFFVKENLSIGVDLGYSNSSTRYGFDPTSISKYKYNGFSLGIGSRKYFSISDKFVFFVGGRLGFNRGTQTQSNASAESTSKQYSLGATIYPGFIFFPSPRWGFEAGIGTLSYNYSKNLSDGTNDNNFNISYGTVTLGVSYYFRDSINLFQLAGATRSDPAEIMNLKRKFCKISNKMDGKSPRF